MKRLSAFLCAILLITGLVGPALAATLVGDQIAGSLVFTSWPVFGNAFDPSVAADPGPLNGYFGNTSGNQPLANVTTSDTTFPEFLYSDTGDGYGGSFNTNDDYLDVVVDVDASDIHVEIIDRSNNDSIPGEADTPLGWTITISDLDWDVPSTLTSVSVTDNTTGVDPFVVTWAPDTIFIEFIGRESNNTNLDDAWITNDHTGYLSADINLQTTVVPLPSAVLLLSSGLLGIVGIRKKIKK